MKGQLMSRSSTEAGVDDQTSDDGERGRRVVREIPSRIREDRAAGGREICAGLLREGTARRAGIGIRRRDRDQQETDGYQ